MAALSETPLHMCGCFLSNSSGTPKKQRRKLFLPVLVMTARRFAFNFIQTQIAYLLFSG
jgi:hypothetical protein